MLKLVLSTILICANCQIAIAVKIENHLAPVNHDCFQRVVLEAMLPEDKVYRTTETNSVRACQDQCTGDGDRCQAFAIGISKAGNGTCQLAAEPAIESGERRPKGTVYDPSFDIYNRKKHCFPVNDNVIPTGGSVPTSPTFSQHEIPTPTILSSVASTYATGASAADGHIDITSSISPPSTITPVYAERPSTLAEEGYTPKEPTYVPSTDTGYGSTGEGQRYPQPTDKYPPRDRYPTSGQIGPTYYNEPHMAVNPTHSMIAPMGGGGSYQSSHEQTDRYEPRPSPMASSRPSCAPYCPYPPHNQHNYQEIYPMQTYPTLYEHNYPMPNDRYPSPQGHRVPTNTDGMMMHGRPPTGPYAGDTAAVYSGPGRPPVYHGSDGYLDRDHTSDSDQYGNNSTAYGMGEMARPTMPQNGGYNTGNVNWEGKYNLTSAETTAMGSTINSTVATNNMTNDNRSDVNRRPNDRNFDRREGPDGPLPYDIRDRNDVISRPCFRRVLAGKRIAPRWVLRTLTCERVEDCQIECGHETRFVCEGFNYRLDPSGRGQGVCELIEVPLEEMGIYSSPSRRDENLIFHPDYDYYERDRNACRPSLCSNCASGSGATGSAYDGYERERPSSGGYGGGGFSNQGNHTDERPHPIRPSHEDYPATTYRPSLIHGQPPREPPREPPPRDNFIPTRYDNRPPPPSREYERHGHDRPPSNWVQRVADRYDNVRPIERPRPGIHDITVYEDRYRHPPPPPPGPFDRNRFDNRAPPKTIPPPYLDRNRGREREHDRTFIPYAINQEVGYTDYWGMKRDDKRPPDFNYFALGHSGAGASKYNPNENSVLSYPGSSYEDRDRNYYGNLWTRRPSVDECSVKSSEGFRLHKAVVKMAYRAPSVTECERMCHAQNGFSCRTYSYRYSPQSRDNCLLCDRAMSHIDYYSDVQPDRDYDIYSMSDDSNSCGRQPPAGNRQNNAQCFFRAIENSRFFSSIVRDSLTVKSIGECEMECIKSSKFTCRAFTYRYGAKSLGSIIDNCQLSDWPVRDMDKERHLIQDNAFEVYERASYGHGCEIQPIADEKHKKFCYLGYGSPAKLLSSAVKKVLSAPTELECKNECIRLRETTSFNCMSFSYGSHASNFNCEMSELDQTQLKLDVHYQHSNDRDFWLFAWNPFDMTCRDKVATIGGDRANNDRRMDIFRKPEGDSPWSQFTVSGRPCRRGSTCDKNLITGFYSCEVDGDEIGSWDYCCRANHPCGYSQGFDYPWCFVGDGSDQWRKCSDKYYPTTTTTGPVSTDNSITISSNHQQVSAPISISISTRRPDHDFIDAENDIHQRPPRPGGLDRHDRASSARSWPVTYLYTTGPPNSTDLSNYVDCNKEHC